MLKLCGVDHYIRDAIKCPNNNSDPLGAENWVFNDTYCQGHRGPSSLGHAEVAD